MHVRITLLTFLNLQHFLYPLQSEVSLPLVPILDYRPSLLFLLVSIFHPPKSFREPSSQITHQTAFFLYVQSWYLALSSRSAIPGIASFITAAQTQTGNASAEITSNIDILLGNLIRAYASNETTDLDYEFGRLIVSQSQEQQPQQQQHDIPPSTALTSAQLTDTQGMQARLVNALNQTYVTLVESWSDGWFVSNLSSKGQLLVENSVLPKQRLAIIAAGKLGSAGMEGN